jgi:PAS domain S-box-containing protein
LLDTAPCGFVAFTDDGRIVAINTTLVERLGLERDAVVGKHVESLLTLATRLFYQTHFFPLLRMHGEAREIFLLLLAKDGETIGMLTNATRRRYGQVDVTECILLEVRERRKYEDALLEAKRAAEEANRQLEDQAVELEMQHQQLQEQATELENQADALQSLNDELVVRTAELEQAQVSAEAANRAKSEFLAAMSHELRTPLNAIGGYTDLLVTGIYGEISPQQREPLERIARSQRHLLGLINDILNLTRVEAGRVEYAIATVRLDEVIAELETMIEPQMTAKAIRFDVELPDRDLTVRADHEKLVQILLNLLSNAVKFTAPEGRITLRAHRDDARRVIRFEVHDTGRGIPDDKLESIFEPFVQVRSHPTKANEGTGLGLAISRNLARGMGGELRAESVLGKGSTFTLTLPATLQ